jgi:hypothetical protein
MQKTYGNGLALDAIGSPYVLQFCHGDGQIIRKIGESGTAERNKNPFGIHYFRYFLATHDRDKVKKE